MTWVLLRGARSSDISSRAAEEIRPPRVGHKRLQDGEGL